MNNHNGESSMGQGYIGNGLASPGYANETCAVRQPEVRAAADSMGYAINDTAELLGLLSDRLSSVLRSSGPSANSVEKAEGYSCDLASHIGLNAGRLRSINSAVRDLLDRLEV